MFSVRLAYVDTFTSQSEDTMGGKGGLISVTALLCLAGFARGVAGIYEQGGDVIMLDSGNFDEVVMETKAIVLVIAPRAPVI